MEQRGHFCAYKGPASVNTETGLITSVVVASGNWSEGRQCPKVAEKDLGLRLPVQTVAADRDYDNTGNHHLLRCKGLHSAVALNRYRTEKSKLNCQK